MPMPKHWVVIAAACAIVAVAAERLEVLRQASSELTAVAEADAGRCGPAGAPPRDTAHQPSVAQPGGIDPLGASRAIRDVLEDCP